jgi:hypothetical protein
MSDPLVTFKSQTKNEFDFLTTTGMVVTVKKKLNVKMKKKVELIIVLQ